ncbi:MAG: exopolysaccharide biosynthesis polyprenyl glycosylphosphotransferase [Armatimonadota bacterium]|nr:exopolysaccharide biosynthesis polyprenyl glycosylphosphotransferase [Armatimonadota bacterium]
MLVSAMDVVSRMTWEDSPLSSSKLVVKRLIDLIAASLALLVCLLLFLFVGLAIKLDSPGPVFFAQARIGKRGRKFTLYKFRSMSQNAEEAKKRLMHLNEASGPVFKITNDPRVTRVGHLLRKFSLDEVPQLINVILGDMSLVGPRPPLPCEVDKYTAHEWKRLSVQPGMTCLWQISGRSDIPFERWVELDLEYIRRQSLLTDLRILVQTVPAVLLGKGAR